MNHNGTGSPKYEIPEEHLLYLKSFGFTWNTITDVLLVSRWSFERSGAGILYGITDIFGFSKISNDELNNLIRDYLNVPGLAFGCYIT